MVLVDLSNKNKTFCKKIINLLKNSDQNIIINSKYLEYEENKEDTIYIKIDYYDKSVGQYYTSISDIDLSQVRNKTEGGNS